MAICARNDHQSYLNLFNDIALLQQNLLYFSKEQIFVDDKKVDDVYLNKESWNICDSNNYF